MARKLNPTPKEIELVAIPEQEITANQNLMSVVQSEYNDERDLANELLGQIQMANAIAKFSDVIGLTKLKYIKENKLYQHLKGKKVILQDGSEISDVGTFEGFCKMLGLSYSKVHEDLSNLNLFGETALEQLNNIGIGYRELRQFRKLPEDQRAELIEVAKSGDQEALLEAAQELVEKQSVEKEQLKKQLADTQRNAKAEQDVLSKRNADLSKDREELSLKLAAFEMKTVPLDSRITPLKQKIAETQSRIDELFNQHRQYIELLKNLQFELMDSDSDYEPGAAWNLPEPAELALLSLNGALVLTLDQAKSMHSQLWNEFGDDIEVAQTRLNNLAPSIE